MGTMGSMLGCDPKSDEDDAEMRKKQEEAAAVAVQPPSILQHPKFTASFNTGVFGTVPNEALGTATVGINRQNERFDVLNGVSTSTMQSIPEFSLPSRNVGTSDLVTSVFGLGTWQFGCAGEDDYWGTLVDQDVANSLMKTAVDLGVTYIDTAEVYGSPQGTSESQIGVALKQLKLKGKVVIGTKIPPTSFEEVEKSLDESLERLGIDCVDLYMVHWPITENAMAHFKAHDMFGADQDADNADNEKKKGPTPTEIAFTALKKCQDAGKIKHIGVSNFGVKQMEEALATGAKIVVNQLCYNLLFRAIEMEILPFCEQHGIGIFAYSPLMQGILSGKWKTADEVPEYRWRSRHFAGTRARSRHGEAGHEELLFSTLAKLQKIADREKMPLADLALAWPLSHPSVACVIGGATKAYQIERNVRAFKEPLSQDLVDELNAATMGLKTAMGRNADLWQGGENTRIQ